MKRGWALRSLLPVVKPFNRKRPCFQSEEAFNERDWL